jgi:hypothetical protein
MGQFVDPVRGHGSQECFVRVAMSGSGERGSTRIEVLVKAELAGHVNGSDGPTVAVGLITSAPLSVRPHGQYKPLYRCSRQQRKSSVDGGDRP